MSFMEGIWMNVLALAISLAIILISCELFTNGVEWLGKRLKLGDGVVGSIFSAVGTCLPETTIPIIAILFSKGMENSVEIGIGAIVGAPFMLSTLAFFVTGISVLIFWKKRKIGLKMVVNNKILHRDIGFFIVVYSLGITATFMPQGVIRYIMAAFLVICYIYYIILTVKHDRESHCELEPLFIAKFFNMKHGHHGLGIILLQVIIALSGIIFGAELFVEGIRHTSQVFKISPLVLSLIITPIATELPEKFNSIIWISKKKDTLALGNITGAMVFQSCIPVSIGIIATSWTLDKMAVASAVLAISSASITYLWIKFKTKLSPLPLIMGGAFYIAFIAYVVNIGGLK